MRVRSLMLQSDWLQIVNSALDDTTRDPDYKPNSGSSGGMPARTRRRARSVAPADRQRAATAAAALDATPLPHEDYADPGSPVTGHKSKQESFVPVSLSLLTCMLNAARGCWVCRRIARCFLFRKALVLNVPGSRVCQPGRQQLRAGSKCHVMSACSSTREASG